MAIDERMFAHRAGDGVGAIATAPWAIDGALAARVACPVASSSTCPLAGPPFVFETTRPEKEER
jgi:hypothetical protein